MYSIPRGRTIYVRCIAIDSYAVFFEPTIALYYTAVCGTLELMAIMYETVGDVRKTVDSAMGNKGLRTVGGVFIEATRALTFRLIDRSGGIHGDALCPLPNGGWITGCYNPEMVRDPTNHKDGLRLRVITGAGRLVVKEKDWILKPALSIDVSAGIMGLPYHITNEKDGLLVVHASSLAFPGNATSTDLSDSRYVLPDELPITQDLVFSS